MFDVRFFIKFTSFKNKLHQLNVDLLRVGMCFFLLFSTYLHAVSGIAGPMELTDTLHSTDTVSIFTENILFPKASAVVARNFSGNSVRIDSILSFLSKTDTKKILNVKVTGSYSPEGEHDFNNNLAEARARALSEFVREITAGISPEISVRHPFDGCKSDWGKLRAAELQIVYRDDSVIADAKCSGDNDITGNCDDSTLVRTSVTDDVADVLPPPIMYC